MSKILYERNINPFAGSIPFLSKHCHSLVRRMATMPEHFPFSQHDEQLELQSSQMGPDLPTRSQDSWHDGRIHCQYLIVFWWRLESRIQKRLTGTTFAKLQVQLTLLRASNRDQRRRKRRFRPVLQSLPLHAAGLGRDLLGLATFMVIAVLASTAQLTTASATHLGHQQ